MTQRQHNLYIISLVSIGTLVTAFIIYFGYSYYLTPIVERVFHPLHKQLKPSGTLGHGYGIIGSLMIIFGVAIYMIRKRVKKFVRFGPLKYWLEFHIFLCTLGPILILFHTAFKFGGIVAVSFYSMAAVVISGVFGRFIYLQIPRTIQGQTIGLDELNNENQNLTMKLRNEYFIDEKLLWKLEEFLLIDSYKDIPLSKITFRLIKENFTNRKLIRSIKREMKLSNISKDKIHQAVKICKAKLILSRRIGLLRTMHKFFKYWHVVHLPFAIIMLLIMIVHVAVTILFGYKWVF